MIVKKWCKGIVTDDRSTVGIRGGCKRSFNDRQKGWLETIAQWTRNGIVEHDRSTIDKRDRWKRSLNNLKKGSLKKIF